MANFWQPKIDRWLENVNINNTSSFPTSYHYAPNEGEEKGKVYVSGHGKLTLQQLKDKISEMINDAASLIKSDNFTDIERLEQIICSSPDLNNLIKQYIEALRKIRSSAMG